MKKSKYRIMEGNTILIEMNDLKLANDYLKEIHKIKPFVYHERHDLQPDGSYHGVRQLEPGDDENGKAKWCHEKLTEEEANNGKHQKCIECNKFEGIVHCPWQLVTPYYLKPIDWARKGGT
jgi:hypothetical protein